MHKRIRYANVVATLALVFAMSGGALAAHHYLITSTKQISPKVLKKLKGARGKTGATGKVGATGKEGATGKDGAKGEIGARGPSDVYEVKLSATTSQVAAGTTLTLSLPNVPAGAYAVSGQATIVPFETNSSSSECVLSAGSDTDKTFTPLRTDTPWIVTNNTQLTHTFTSTGTVSMACRAFGDKWALGANEFGDTRIIATRVETQNQTTAAAT
jgi:hypothetical protein